MPPAIRKALAEADIGYPTSPTASSSTPPILNGTSKPDPSVLGTPPPPLPPPVQNNLIWAPFPSVQYGVPLGSVDKGGHMDITSILDSGIDGDFPQLNRDGFTLNGSGEQLNRDGLMLNMSGEDEALLWGINWV